MNGYINLYKPSGISSHDCIYKVRRALGTKKVGHTGTLDPMAEGVLPICVGKATRASDMIMASVKEYSATLTFGSKTTTADSEGEVLKSSEKIPSREEFESVIPSFLGEIEQIPPMYSAVHHEGKRLYKLARAGQVVERSARKIKIFDIKLLDFEEKKAKLYITCSKGTYIRTLLEDMAEAAGAFGHMSALTRCRSGVFTIENSIKIDEISEELLMPTDSMFGQFEKIVLTADNEVRVRNGVPLKIGCKEGETYRVYSEGGEFLCLSKGTMQEGRSVLKMLKSFY